MKYMMSIILSIIALTVVAPGHAEEINKHDLDCLARNIYYEAGSESEEGKVAVGLVTINRSNHEKFPNSICGVVNQKTTVKVPKTVTHVREIREGVFFVTVTKIVEKQVVWTEHAICQFSWRCETVHKIKTNDLRWENCLEVARELLSGGYNDFRAKYRDAMYFHEASINPSWAKQKQRITRIGAHIFYAEKNTNLTLALQ